MIDMGMGQERGVDLADLEREREVRYRISVRGSEHHEHASDACGI